MKQAVTLLNVFLLMILLCVSACKKNAGLGGKNKISGTVYYKNAVIGDNTPAANATVHITYGATEQTTNYNQALLCNANGNYTIDALHKGSYFLKASYKDANGFTYQTAGYVIELNNKKSEVLLNIILE